MGTIRTTAEAAKETGMSKSMVLWLVERGIVKPAFYATGRGYGSQNGFDDHGIAQLRAYRAIRQDYGDGRLAREIIARVPEVRAGQRRIEVGPSEVVFA